MNTYWAKTSREGQKESSTFQFHSVPHHCLDVAAVAYQLLVQDEFLRNKLANLLQIPSQSVPNFLAFLLSLHDIGKFSPRFQAIVSKLFMYLQQRECHDPYSDRHDTVGYITYKGDGYDQGLLLPWLQKQQPFSTCSPEAVENWLEPLLQATMGHHGRPVSKDPFCDYEELFEDQDLQAIQSYVEDCYQLFSVKDLPLPKLEDETEQNNTKNASWFFAGFAVLCDWLGSNAESFPLRNGAPQCLRDYWNNYAIPQAKNAINMSGVLPPPVQTQTGFQALFPHLATPTSMQQHVCDLTLPNTPQLFILEGETGSGKTEAAFLLAHRLLARGDAQGIYVGLPTMATANGMYLRMPEIHQQLFQKPKDASLLLSHSARGLSARFQQSIQRTQKTNLSRTQTSQQDESFSSAQCNEWLADNRKKTFLGALAVGTIDQALLGILPSFHQSLRLFGLGRLILIVDEVHSCDEYMNKLLCNLLQFQAKLGNHTILLSATLSQEDRNRFVQCYLEDDELFPEQNHFPLITQVTNNSIQEIPTKSRPATTRNLHVQTLHTTEEAYQYIEETISSGQCACWIRNTVDDAIDAWRFFQQRFGNERVLLFHSRFAMCDRQRIEEQCLTLFGKKSTGQQRSGKLLIATQVLEQSLDVDFDVMLSDLAPIDLLLQRAGRMQRHTRDAKGNVIPQGPDQRPHPLFSILSPPYEEKPSANWYKELFPRAHFVYTNVGRLWLTAQLLHHHHTFEIPAQTRELIESVYSDDAQQKIPDSLQRATQKALGTEQANHILANYNQLHHAPGYGGDRDSASHWERDVKTPTRLGEPTHTLRLLRVDGQGVRPWANKTRHPWAMSQLQIRASKVNAEPPEQAALLEKARADMFDEGRWVLLTPLTPTEQDGTWKTHMLRANQQPIHLLYNAQIGLHQPSPENEANEKVQTK